MSGGSGTGRAIGLGIAAALLIGLFVAWFLHTHERVEETDDLPPRGEAAYNPLFALKLALADDGRKVVARPRLQLRDVPLKPADTLLLLGDTRQIPAPDRDAILAWVRSGGHLIVRTPPMGSTGLLDFGNAGAEDIDAVPLLSDLGVEPLAYGECLELEVDGFDGHTEFCNGRAFSLDAAAGTPRLAWDTYNEGEYGFARLLHGKGTVDVLADLDFATNEQLEEGPHYALTRQLLEPNYDRGGVFHLIYRIEMPSLWSLLWAKLWMLLLPCALGIAVWLWMRGERLGPLRPSPADDRRSLLEHVHASGEHLYRYGRAGRLYAAVFDAFLQRLHRRDPYAAALEGQARVDAIARRTGLPAHEVEAALRYPRPGDARDFVQRVAQLLKLRQRL